MDRLPAETRKTTLAVILLSGSLTVMAGAIIAPVVNVMRRSLDVDPVLAGIIITTHSIFIAALSPVVGVVIDRVGVKKPFLLGLVLYGLAGGAGMWLDSFWLLIASRALLGVAVSVIFVSNTVMILNIFRGARRNRVMGWRGTANALGGVLWPLLGGALGSLSWHLPFAVYLAGVPLAALGLVFVPEAHPRVHEPGGEELSVIQLFRRTPVLLFIYVLIFISSVLLYAIVVYLPPMLEELGEIRPLYIGLFISVMGLAAASTSFMYGRIKSALSYRSIVILAVALWGAGFLSVSRFENFFLLGCAIALFGMGQGMLSPACMVWVGEEVPTRFRGRISSFLGTFGFVGQFLSPVLFAPVVMALGPRGVFTAGGAASALLLVLILFVGRRRG